MSNRKTTEGKGASFYDRVVLLCFEQQRDNLRTRRLFFFNYFSSLLAAFMTLTTLFACYHSSGEAFAALLFSYPARTFELCSPTPHYTEWPRNALKDLLPVFISDIIFLVSSSLVFFFFSLSFSLLNALSSQSKLHVLIYIFTCLFILWSTKIVGPENQKKKKNKVLLQSAYAHTHAHSYAFTSISYKFPGKGEKSCPFFFLTSQKKKKRQHNIDREKTGGKKRVFASSYFLQLTSFFFF